MKKTFEIGARLEKKVEDGVMFIRITWETMADDMCEAISKARAYIRWAEHDECASCSYMTIEETKIAGVTTNA